MLLGEKIEDLGVSAAGRRLGGEGEGGHCGSPEPLHACALLPARVHVGLCQMCPRVLTYRCRRVRVHVFTHPCLREHARAHCVVTWLHRHAALHTRVPAWPRAHPAVHASTWSHAQSRTCTGVCRYTSPWSRTRVLPLSSPVPAPRFGVSLGPCNLGGGGQSRGPG